MGQGEPAGILVKKCNIPTQEVGKLERKANVCSSATWSEETTAGFLLEPVIFRNVSERQMKVSQAKELTKKETES